MTIVQIIISEKPQAAVKIERVTGIKTIPLVGHLLELQKQDFKWTPPYFNIVWKPKRGLKQKLENVKSGLKQCDDVVIATDYDAEGQLIALNVLRYSDLKPQNVVRMKFSSLEEEEIIKSFQHPIVFDLKFAQQAEVRHYLDWYFGMNISKVITMLRNSKQFLLTPVGRVQSPTLRWISEREIEIGSFVSKDVWYTDVYGVYGEDKNKVFEIGTFSFENEEKATKFMDNVLTGKVDRIEKATYLLKTHPPNTNSVMRYGFSCGLSAQVIEKILQDLYLNEYCSYPRTNSQKYISHGVDTKRYLKRLFGVVEKAEDAINFLPLEGEENDVHPAIYPIRVYTENDIRSLIWRYIAESFVKCHLPPIKESYKTLYVEINEEVITSREIPIDIDSTKEFELTYRLNKGKTAPPNRYKEENVYEWMTENNIGTRDTRPQIITKVLKRYAYETSEGIFLSSLGMKITNILEKFCPDLIDTGLTRTFEEKIYGIESNNSSVESILSDGRKTVTELVQRLLEHEEEVTKIIV